METDVVKRKRIIVGVFAILLAALATLWVIAAGRCEIFLLKDAKPLAGCTVYEVGAMRTYVLDEHGKLYLGWHLFDRPKQLFLEVSRGNEPVWSVVIDADACRGCAIDRRGNTTITTKKVRFLFLSHEERVVTTQLGPRVESDGGK
jgi:hypothetical protein